jgi:two-component system phosphate regulon sensor histidine kinase PhoR
MERLVGDLLRLARLDARQETPERVETDLPALVDGVVGELSPLVDSRGTTVTVTIDESARRLTTDPARLQDVVRNLLENAITYAPEDGRVQVSARAADRAVVIEVADDGPGIPPADLERVFERFYRVDKSRARNPGGTGIGLAIVKHLVELLGGSVRASNARDGGAVFTVTLPTGPARVDQLAPNRVASL